MRKKLLHVLVITIVFLSIFLPLITYASVYTSKTSRIYHDRNCSKIDTEDLIEFSSPQKADAAGAVPCEYCNPSAVSEENISMGNIGMGASTEQRTESSLSYRVADIPAPKRHVEDRADLIDEHAEITLNGLLSELEMKTGVQMIVLTNKTTGGIPIDQFSIDLANKWKLGQFGQDNGVLVVVVRDDRKYSIEVGSGLERILPNDFCAEVGETIFVPNFRTGNYSQGINQGSNAIVNRIAQDAGVSIKGTQSQGMPSQKLIQTFSIKGVKIGMTMAQVKKLFPSAREGVTSFYPGKINPRLSITMEGKSNLHVDFINSGAYTKIPIVYKVRYEKIFNSHKKPNVILDKLETAYGKWSDSYDGKYRYSVIWGAKYKKNMSERTYGREDLFRCGSQILGGKLYLNATFERKLRIKDDSCALYLQLHSCKIQEDALAAEKAKIKLQHKKEDDLERLKFR